MRLESLQKKLTNALIEAAKETFEIELENVAAEVPPKIQFGDLAFPVAFEMAKKLKAKTGEKQNPRALAEQLKESLETNEIVSKVDIAGPGYLNVFYDRAFLTEAALKESEAPASEETVKICVEHTSVNPNKAAHVGHLRNSVLGDSFIRILKAGGYDVETQNYIDNTGVQVADVVVGFVHLKSMDLEAIKALDEKLRREGVSFDFHCWDLYAEVGQEYQKNESLLEKRTETLHAIEAGDNELAELADYVATRNVECLIDTMERISIRYDVLPRESEILHLNFWEKAFEMMKERGVIKFADSGKHEGCWVMPFDSHAGSDDHEQDKILVRSNGTVTYTGKDIAYQMWKLGLLGMDFNYRVFGSYDDGKKIWVSTSKEGEQTEHSFGNAKRVYNVIDTRQSYPQQVVKQGVALIFPDAGEEASIHLSYEMVALSPKAAVELGFELSEEDMKRPHVEMSGRKGLGVKADDLIDRLEQNAFGEVSERNPDLPEERRKAIATQIAVGALRYFLMKFTKNTLIVFDFDEATAFEGETGTYCQNATVRLNSIFRKAGEETVGAALKDLPDHLTKISDVYDSEEGNDLWSVVITAMRLDDAIKQSIAQAEPAVVAKYAFNMAKTSNLFYQKFRILDEQDESKKVLLIAVAEIARRALTDSLGHLGIEIPERM